MTSTAALSQPLYGATFGQAVKRFFAKYSTFSGRASRSEFWWVALFEILLNAVFVVLLIVVLLTTGEQTETGVRGTGPEIVVLVIWGIVALALIIPHIAITVRRLHDGNFSGVALPAQPHPVGGLDHRPGPHPHALQPRGLSLRPLAARAGVLDPRNS